MNVLPGHILYPLYRLWIYLISKSLITPWFIKRETGHYLDEYKTEPESFIPRSLCPFLNRLVLYFIVQVPIIFVAGLMMSLITIYSQVDLLMALYVSPGFVAGMELCADSIGGLAVIGGILILVEIVVLFVVMYIIIMGKLEANKEKKWAKFALDVVAAADETPKLFFKPIIYPFGLFKLWYQAHHDKFCPSLSFEQKTTSEKE